MLFSVVAVALATSTPAPELHASGVNLYIGDLSAIVGGYVPSLEGLSPAEAERARVRGHLSFTHDMLATVDTSTWPVHLREARARNLQRLATYAERGEFPHDDDHPDRYRPTFVDSRGTICAVGALFAADHGRSAAERIAAAGKYAFVAEIHDPELVAWQQSSGLTMTELALIQPTYGEAPNTGYSNVWLPFGLLDRMQYAPPRVTVASEVGSSDGWGTLGLTVHAQASLQCDCHLGFYGTFPMSIVLDDRPLPFAAAGGPSPRAPRESALGTMELGMFAGGEKFNGRQNIYRIGALLPTAPSEIEPRFASARVGDAVLELPRSAGIRISVSQLSPWLDVPSRWLWPDSNLDVAFRYDLGFDAVQVLGEQLHAIPRIAGGALVSGKLVTMSFDTALSIPDPDGVSELRWSAGITAGLARRGGAGGLLQPALGIATVRTGDGWGMTLSLAIATTARPHRGWAYASNAVTRTEQVAAR